MGEVLEYKLKHWPGTIFRYPKPLLQCVKKVFEGEYALPPMPPDFPVPERIVDVGANVGAFAVWASAKFPGCWITCYEPHPVAADFCRQNAPPGTRVVEAAVAGAATTLKVALYVGKNDDWGYNSLLSDLNPNEGDTVDVDLVPAADLPPCDLLKLDCEGPELGILQGYKHLAGVNLLMIEWHREEDLLPIMHCCQAAGLRLVRNVHDAVNRGQMIWARTDWVWDIGLWKWTLPVERTKAVGQPDPTFALAISHTPWVQERAGSLERLLSGLGEGQFRSELARPSSNLPSLRDVRIFKDKAPNWLWSQEMWVWAECTDVTHCVFLQDDVIPSPYFWDYLTEMVKAVGNQVIGLHVVHPGANALRQKGQPWFRTHSWLVGVAYVFPREVLREFLIWRSQQPEEKIKKTNEDSLINDWMGEVGRDCWHPVPTIVEHDLELDSQYNSKDDGYRTTQCVLTVGEDRGWAVADHPPLLVMPHQERK